MIAVVREECGLGSPPTAFTTNASETANYMLKHKVNYKKSELSEFLTKLRQLIEDQQREVEKAIIGRGKFELRSQYRSWYVPETKWFSMSQSQRTSHLNKFAAASLSDVNESEINELCIGRDNTLSSTLSVHVDSFASEVRIPRPCLEGIWSKAAELLKTKNEYLKLQGLWVANLLANLFLVIVERGHTLLYQKKVALLHVMQTVQTGKPWVFVPMPLLLLNRTKTFLSKLKLLSRRRRIQRSPALPKQPCPKEEAAKEM